ncbi:hypothetical protein LJC25_01645 [Bacteroidales bacterium OttesenSCG-928-K03]|nr:hypothetical protein [Odoribacter sp. OttesenSCG-928-L07]MDL2238814.1 hypothetical protein [Bacteroidales bacterium OttesenSCG-928-L14]MDL2240253.1 hypothetical protein [Bacteroidales bacterium OttesenSCG-928-K22]MDL2242411.1 hypothetical protein [Bacteroidales bacterium OttesenSCG-928-K03]
MKIETNTYEKTTKFLFNFLLLVVAIITFLPLLKVGFVHADDVEYFLMSDPKLWGGDAQHYAHISGRFYFLITKWIYAIPYLVDSQLYYYSVRIIPLIVGVILLFLLIKRAGYDKQYILIGLLTFLSSFQLYGAGSSVTSYPFYFSFAIILILCSLHLLLDYYKTGKYYYIIFSSLLFAFVSLFHESILMYYILIFIIVVSRYNIKTFFKKQQLLKFIKELAPFVICGILYIVVYFYYSHLHPTKYSGNMFVSSFSLAKTLKIFLSIIADSCPLSSFLYHRFALITYSDSISTDYSIFFYLKEAGTLSYIKAFTIVLLYIVTLKLFPQNISRKKITNMIVLGIFATILPSIPLLFSAMTYNILREVYVTSYFSFVGIIIVFASLIYLINSYLKKKRVLYIITNCVIVILLFFISVFSQYSNEFVAKDINISQERLLILKDFKESAHLKDNDIVCTQNLYFSNTISGKNLTSQKSVHIAPILNKLYDIEINEYRNYNDLYKEYKTSEDTINLFFYSQAAKTYDTYISLVKCKGNELTPNIKDIKTDNIKVAYRSSYKKFSVSIASENNIAKVNQTSMASIGPMNIANIYYFQQQKSVVFSINGEALFPASLTINNMLNSHGRKINIGAYNPSLQEAYTNHNEKIIMRNKTWVNNIDKKAKKRDVPFEQALNDDAVWLIYN